VPKSVPIHDLPFTISEFLQHRAPQHGRIAVWKSWLGLNVMNQENKPVRKPRERIRSVLERHPEIRIALLFGSLAAGKERRNSDLDLAVAAGEPLGAQQKAALIEELAQVTGRAVDVVDLRTAAGLVLKNALTTGVRLRVTDHALLAELVKRMWFDEADFEPYRRRILEARRKQWISG
jgi:predicted nucleotidyltransferase